MKPNKRLLKKILKKIEADRKCWDQQTWHCGTTHCFAGHVSLEVLPKYPEIKKSEWMSDEGLIQRKEEIYVNQLCRKDDKTAATIDKLADELNSDRTGLFKENTAIIAAYHLGLDGKTARSLFVPSNTLPRLKKKISKIIGEPV